MMGYSFIAVLLTLVRSVGGHTVYTHCLVSSATSTLWKKCSAETKGKFVLQVVYVNWLLDGRLHP